MQWRPIAECPPDLTRAIVYAPDNFRYDERDGVVLPQSLSDERVVSGDRGADGKWWVDHYQGSYDVTPTHFLDPGVPPGCPITLDIAGLQADCDRKREEAARQAALRAARAAAEHEAAERARAEIMEAYWADIAAVAQAAP